MPRVLVVPVEGEPYLKSLEHYDVGGLQPWWDLVGGYLQAIPLGDDSVMYLNEDGKNYSPPLDINPHANRLIAFYNPGLAYGDYIVGNVFITGDADEDGNNTDVPEDVVNVASRICI